MAVGSQKPTAMPIRLKIGGGKVQAWIGLEGFFVSGKPLEETFTFPILIGNKHFQQTSVIGLTQRPLQATSAKED